MTNVPYIVNKNRKNKDRRSDNLQDSLQRLASSLCIIPSVTFPSLLNSRIFSTGNKVTLINTNSDSAIDPSVNQTIRHEVGSVPLRDAVQEEPQASVPDLDQPLSRWVSSPIRLHPVPSKLSCVIK